MNRQEVDNYLNEIYLEILNCIDANGKSKSESDAVRIIDKLSYIKKFIEPNSRQYDQYNVLYNTSFFVLNGQTLNANEASDANKYFNWMKSAQKIAEKKAKREEISLEDAIEFSNACNEVKYPTDNEIRKIIYKSRYPNAEIKKPAPLPKKVSVFDKIRNRLRSFFSGNKQKKQAVPPRPAINQNAINRARYYETNNANRFREENRVNESNQPVRRPEPQEETIVIGDLHGDMQKWLYVKNALRKNPKLKLIMLGDAMDRGKYGLEILLQIKELCENGRAVYLPGNHDAFAYNYLKTKGTKFEDYEASQRAKANWEGNGGAVTMQSFEHFDQIQQSEIRRGNLRRNISKEELIDWLGSCPIQMKTRNNKYNYALAHAMFDEKLYNEDPQYNLRKALVSELAGRNDENLKRFYNCMWYRERR